jgi:ABC-type glutathione transport system ATPase component
MIRLARELGPKPRESHREQDLRSFLGSFNFSGDMVKQAVGTMSGGEKARLVLAMMVWQRPNLLLLDEPTNHLDLATREALAMALNEFEGTVMLVSHDRALLRAVCDEFWLVGRGVVSPRSTAIWTTTSATCSTRPSASAKRRPGRRRQAPESRGRRTAPARRAMAGPVRRDRSRIGLVRNCTGPAGPGATVQACPLPCNLLKEIRGSPPRCGAAARC